MSYAPDAPVARRSFLVVDDSRVVRRVARRILESLDFEVREAENGQMGLAACATHMPDAILLDWNMPVMNGLDFLRSLRGSDGGGGPFVLLCSTESDLEHIQMVMEAGANHYIIKPFDNEILNETLQAAGLA